MIRSPGGNFRVFRNFKVVHNAVEGLGVCWPKGLGVFKGWPASH
jgi:hypothetical protein